MTSLGDRMKEYENVSKDFLTRRMPIIMRIDGKTFHTYTKNMKRPWDKKLYIAFGETAKELCSRIQGAKLAYFQSDEISILITDYDTIKTEAWFNNNVQKMVSVGASIATMQFNYEMNFPGTSPYPALFDCRVFNIPKEDVCNYFIWRQQDAERNSVQMLGRSYFSNKEMESLSNNQVQDKLMLEKNINWNNCEVWQKRGACVVNEEYQIDDLMNSNQSTWRSHWVIDDNIPIFLKDREYINQYVYL